MNPWLATPEQYEAMRERVAKARNEGSFTPPGLTDTIAMPGNQGGSNWGTTAADPQKGMVFVVGVNQVAILKLEDVTDAHGRTRARRRRRRGQRRAAGGLRRVPAVLHRLPRREPSRRASRRRHLSSASPIAWARTRSGQSSPAAKVKCGRSRASPNRS